MDRVRDMLPISTFEFKDVPGGWLGLVTACVSVYASYWMCRFCHYKYRVSETKKKIRRRQEERDQHITTFRKYVLSKKGTFDPAITSLEFKELQRRLANGDLKAVDVLLAFQHHAIIAHDEINCVTEFLEDAMERALKLDQIPSHLRGPLHGIPISLKECVGVAGKDSTLGIAKWIGKTFEEDGVLVKVLIDQGAVPFARTNVPQLMMSIECSNPIFGETKNPKNPKRTCGGSSGGEGALIGAGASVLGLGCDMGGSNRVPSHLCGIAGLKSTPDRLSNVGNNPYGMGIVSLSEIYGPLGRDVDSLVEFMKATLVPRLYELDPLIPKMPWNDELYKSKEPLKIGYYTCHDGGVEPVPAVKRAVMTAVRNLEKMGHTVVEFDPPDVLYMFEHLFMAIMSGDGGKEIIDLLKYDVIDPSIQVIIRSIQYPLPSVVKKLISLLPGMHPITKILINFKWPRTVSEWWDKNVELEAYKRRFCSKMASQGIQCLVCPPIPFTAWPIGETEHSLTCDTYVALYNLLGFPAGVVPTTTVTPKDVEQMKDYPTHTDVHKYVHQITKESEGLPVGVQCAGLPFEEETVLRLMKELETLSQSAQG